MLRRSTSTRTAVAALAAGLGLSLVSAVVPASAAPTSTSGSSAPVAASVLKMSGPYAAAADGSLVTLDVPAISPPILPQTNVDLGRSRANAESDNDLDTDQAGAQRTSASAATTGESSLLGAGLDLAVTEASAPEPESNSDTILPLDLAPLLDLEVIRTTALANWVSDTECVAADTPLSQADQALADLTLLAPAAGQSVLALDTDEDDGAVDTEAATFLASIPGANDPRAVQARVVSDISSANLFNGFIPELASAIQVDAVKTPNYVVSASGIPGGASVTGDDPVVEVTIGGEDIITIDTTNQTTEAVLTDLVLGDLLDLEAPGLLTDLVNDLDPTGTLALLIEPIEAGVQAALAELQPVVALKIPVDKEVNPDGTFARVEAALLQADLLLPEAVGAAGPIRDGLQAVLDALGAEIGESLLTLRLGPVAAEVTAPAGGITCGEPQNPLRELNKHASALEVAPGGTFEYNIAVPNRGPCALTNVTVTDVVTGPAGFQIVDTEPDATIEGGKVTFNVGNLAVNETKNLTITVKVPEGARDGDTFDDVVTASGTCDGRTVTKDDRVDDTPTVRDDFSGPCNVQFSNKDASHIQVFAGQTFGYYVHAFNSGGEPCNDVTITDTLDDRVSFVSCNKSCTHEGNQVTWKVPSIPGGSSVILSVVVKVDDDATGVLENAAVITPANGKATTVKTRGPVIGPDSIPKDPAPASRNPLPKTGGMVPAGAALLLGAGAFALHQLRRRAAVV